MNIITTGVFFTAECEIQKPGCTAILPAPVTAIKTEIGRTQINVCRACLETMVRDGQWSIEGARFGSQADFIVYDKLSNPVLIVECKIAQGTSQDNLKLRATQVRRNLIAHSAIPNTRFMMIVYYPAVAFLWANSNIDDIDGGPTYVIDLSRELQAIGQIPDSGNDFVNADAHVSRWLSNIMAKTKGNGSNPSWLAESGLADAIRANKLVEHTALAA